jgi:hypothetical protein
MLLVVIIMSNDLWGFSIDPSYFGYNSVKQENPVLCIFTFQDSSRTQIDLALIFYHENLLEHKKSTREAMRAKRVLMARAQAQATPPNLV